MRDETEADDQKVMMVSINPGDRTALELVPAQIKKRGDPEKAFSDLLVAAMHIGRALGMSGDVIARIVQEMMPEVENVQRDIHEHCVSAEAKTARKH